MQTTGSRTAPMLHTCVPRSPAVTRLNKFQYQLQVCPCFCPSALFFILLIPVLAASTLPDFICPLMVRNVLYGIYFFMLFNSFISSFMASPLCIRAVYATALPMICCFVPMRGNRPPHPLPRIHPSHWLWNREALRPLTSVHFQVRQQCPCCRCCCKHKM